MNDVDINEVRKIAWDWAQGVDDAETAIRKLNKLFPIYADEQEHMAEQDS